ncbi:MAG: response regulator [Chloroflexota bacterium]|nr:response regulator [Chloroflexota bacterium]
MSPRILVANDSPDMAELYQDILTFEGYHVILHPICSLEIEAVGQSDPDLILLDYPIGLEQAGCRVLQQLRQEPSTCSLPIVLCTTMIGEVEKREPYLLSNSIGVVLKPFEIDDLVRAIERSLEAGSKSGRYLTGK